MAVIVYDLIDEDMNGTLAKEELVEGLGEDEDVIEFVVKCTLQCINQMSRRVSTPSTRRQHRAPGDLSPLDSRAPHWLIYAQVRSQSCRTS